MQEIVTSALENWSSLYSNHAALRTFIGFLHVGGLVVSGGIAINSDHSILVARRREDSDRALQLRNLQRIHRVVFIGLVAVIVSGLLLFAADSGTFLHSVLFWIKMSFFAALLVNGAVLRHAGSSAETGDPKAWNRLRTTAIASITLWLITTLVGSALPNIG